tara:strand:- start:136 stop:942 length:807 start_codon:yes stop_codon:yes gene_type:complete
MPEATLQTEDSITLIINGSPLSMRGDNPQFANVENALIENADDDTLAALFEPARQVTKYSEGKVVVEGGEVKYNGEVLNNYLTQKIINFMERGFPVKSYLLFLENLMANPSNRSREQLFAFLENGSMPITPEGFFIGYKGVQDNYKDQYSGTVDNSVGAKPSLDRGKVCDDPRQGCSYGYHVGSVKYANGWSQRTMLVKVNPANCVCVPFHEDQKLRCCEYEVIGELPREQRHEASTHLDDDFVDDGEDWGCGCDCDCDCDDCDCSYN